MPRSAAAAAADDDTEPGSSNDSAMSEVDDSVSVGAADPQDPTAITTTTTLSHDAKNKETAILLNAGNSPRDVNYLYQIKVPTIARPPRELILQRLSEALLRRCLTKVCDAASGEGGDYFSIYFLMLFVSLAVRLIFRSVVCKRQTHGW